jgi:hypothetical protein
LPRDHLFTRWACVPPRCTDAAFKAGTSSLCGVERDPRLLHGSEKSGSDLPRPPSACGDGDRYVLGLLQQRPHGHKARLRPGPAVQQGRVTGVRKELDLQEAPYLEEPFAWTSTPSEADSPTSYLAFSTNTSISYLLIFLFFYNFINK